MLFNIYGQLWTVQKKTYKQTNSQKSFTLCLILSIYVDEAFLLYQQAQKKLHFHEIKLKLGLSLVC